VLAVDEGGGSGRDGHNSGDDEWVAIVMDDSDGGVGDGWWWSWQIKIPMVMDESDDKWEQ